jgi:hypothetical protein
MKDRIPTYEGRVTLTPVSGATNTYDMVRADVPIQDGTPLNKATLLTDSTAALMGLTEDATPEDMLRAMAQKLNSMSTTLNTATTDLNNLKSLITYGTSDLTAGSSTLATGHLYVVYE